MKIENRDDSRAEARRGIFLELRQVSKSYQRGQETVWALQDCSVTFAPGQLTLVLGPSGGGKSTLLQVAGGMDRATSGEIWAAGTHVSGLIADRLAQWRRRTIGFVFQNFYLLPGCSAEDNVALPLLIDGQGRSARRSRARELLTALGLGQRTGHTPEELSGGQIQRVAIARALVHNAPVILADEPTGNLDTENGREIMVQLRALARDDGRTVIVVSHNPEYRELADRVITIRDGRIEHDSNPVAPTASFADTPKAPDTGPRLSALVAESLRSVGRRCTRGILTSLGVMIGVASMVLLISVGAGLQSKVITALSGNASLTSMTVNPSPHASGLGLELSSTSAPIHPIGLSTIRAFRAVPHVRTAYGSSEFLLTAQVHGRSTAVAVTSLPPSNIGGLPHPHLLAGHLPNRNQGGIVLPQSTLRALFNLHGRAVRALGRKVDIELSGALSSTGIASPSRRHGTMTMVVRGVVSTSLASTGYVDAATAQGWLKLTANPHQAIQYATAVVVATGIGQVHPIAAALRREGYGVTTTGSAIEQIHHEFGIVEAALGAVGGVALTVAGLMIAVVMSMAVLERRREIGVWRALGARRRDVFVLFLLEAVIIGGIGGAVGVLVGWGLGQLGSELFHQPGLFLVPFWLVIVGLAFGGGIAAVAGAIPANHAARLRPVEALRGE